MISNDEYRAMTFRVRTKLGLACWTHDIPGMVAALPTEALEYVLSEYSTPNWDPKWKKQCELEYVGRIILE
jgi:hypothetical protein